MALFSDEDESRLSNEDKASAINLAFFLDVTNYNIKLLKQISDTLNEDEKQRLYQFWRELSPSSARAYLCMAEFEGRL